MDEQSIQSELINLLSHPYISPNQHFLLVNQGLVFGETESDFRCFPLLEVRERNSLGVVFHYQEVFHVQGHVNLPSVYTHVNRLIPHQKFQPERFQHAPNNRMTRSECMLPLVVGCGVGPKLPLVKWFIFIYKF